MTQHTHSPHPRALARRCDPITSHQAAAAAGRLIVSHHARILMAMPTGAALGAEQIGDLCGIPAYEVRKRLPELADGGAVRLEPGLRKTRSGRRERLWRRVD